MIKVSMGIDRGKKRRQRYLKFNFKQIHSVSRESTYLMQSQTVNVFGILNQSFSRIRIQFNRESCGNRDFEIQISKTIVAFLFSHDLVEILLKSQAQEQITETVLVNA